MVRKIWSVSIGGLDAFDVLVGPAAVITDLDLVDGLQPQALFPDRDSHPEHALIVLKTVPADPCCALRKLHIVQYNQGVRMVGFGEETGKRREIWLISRYDHLSTVVVVIPLRFHTRLSQLYTQVGYAYSCLLLIVYQT